MCRGGVEISFPTAKELGEVCNLVASLEPWKWYSQCNRIKRDCLLVLHLGTPQRMAIRHRQRKPSSRRRRRESSVSVGLEV